MNKEPVMNTTKLFAVFLSVASALVMLLVTTACTPLSPVISLSTPVETGMAGEVAYQVVSLPEPDGVRFELPDDWSFWGNAGYLSNDGGSTLAGIRMSWIKQGQDAAKYLYNEGSTVHEKTIKQVGHLETTRFIVETSLTNASTGEEIWHAYEMIYAFPAPGGEKMIGATVSAPSMEALYTLVPVAEHMVSTITFSAP
jgi:hypothetical protein